MKSKKKFKDTTVGKILGGTLGLINPTLGNIVQGSAGVEDLIASIKNSNATPEEKATATSLVLEAYEAEVQDRIAARDREARVAASGGGDYLFKSVGWGIVLAFLLIVLYAIGIIPQDENLNHDFLMFASGSVTTAFMAVVSYFFGSSLGSKQKSHIMSKDK